MRQAKPSEVERAWGEAIETRSAILKLVALSVWPGDTFGDEDFWQPL